MAILNKESFLAKIQARIGEDTSDEAMSFLEDMTDTYNDMESKTNDTTDWKQKYSDLDKSWREKYKARFFSGEGSSAGDNNDNLGGIGAGASAGDDEPKGTETNFEDLFTESEG